jgi:hypothetical protein
MILSMDAIMEDNTPLAQKYIDNATVELNDPQTHINTINKILP